MAAAVGSTAYENFTYGSPKTLTTGMTSTASGSSFLVYFYTATGDTVSSVTDSKSNTYSLVTSINETTNANTIWLYKAENGTGGASHTCTVTMTSGGVVFIGFIEITGAETSGIIDVSNQAYDAASPFGCAVTTTVADVLLLGVAGYLSGSLSGSYTAGGSFTKFYDHATTWGFAAASRSVTSTGTYDPAWTHSVRTYSAMITVAIKSAAAATGQPTMRRFGGVPGMTPGGGGFGRSWKESLSGLLIPERKYA